MARTRAPIDLTLFHGSDGEDDSERWFTTCERHASQFGDVSRYRVVDSDAVHIDCATDEDLAGKWGATGDAALMRVYREEGRRSLVLRGWEGGDDVITVYAGESADVEAL